MTNDMFLIAAYLVIWGGLFTYLLFTNGQQHKLAKRLQILEEIVCEQERKK